jgi:hypothetical protein
MHFLTKMFALAAIALGATVASDAAADGEEPEDPPPGGVVDIETAKKIIIDKLNKAQAAATINCVGRKDEFGRMGSHGSIRMTLLISHLGNTHPINISQGKGATAKCVAQYFTFKHPAYKGPDVQKDYGVTLREPAKT